ncbi:MAG: RdgB/HAM1 family non-canonical purine NTP pyrophosphatase [Deltaproteobacteria bacterium]|nr:RdgB/HAM1 family non-canonical purine NTP pyrophosphatase [Deltaproteobacteria bacterium]
MSAQNKIIIATKNAGKLREIRHILNDIPFCILGMSDINIDIEIEENGNSYLENALIKAREVYKAAKNIVVSDDSGLEVDILGKRPGIFSARYANSTEERIVKLLGELRGVPFEKRRARFVCVACLLINENIYHLFQGTVEGFISFEPKGTNGFGFDPIFFVPEYNKTMAELPLEIKNKISHRAKAFSDLRDFLKSKIHNFSNLVLNFLSL